VDFVALLLDQLFEGLVSLLNNIPEEGNSGTGVRGVQFDSDEFVVLQARDLVLENYDAEVVLFVAEILHHVRNHGLALQDVLRLFREHEDSSGYGFEAEVNSELHPGFNLVLKMAHKVDVDCTLGKRNQLILIAKNASFFLYFVNTFAAHANSVSNCRFLN
jgi:hypothetical protein